LFPTEQELQQMLSDIDIDGNFLAKCIILNVEHFHIYTYQKRIIYSNIVLMNESHNFSPIIKRGWDFFV
jgi:hypothetical protein